MTSCTWSRSSTTARSLTSRKAVLTSGSDEGRTSPAASRFAKPESTASKRLRKSVSAGVPPSMRRRRKYAGSSGSRSSSLESAAASDALGPSPEAPASSVTKALTRAIARLSTASLRPSFGEAGRSRAPQARMPTLSRAIRGVLLSPIPVSPLKTASGGCRLGLIRRASGMRPGCRDGSAIQGRSNRLGP